MTITQSQIIALLDALITHGVNYADLNGSVVRPLARALRYIVANTPEAKQ